MNLPKKVFVTGGAGFIGSHMVDALAAQGCEVTVYDNFRTGKKEFLKDQEKNKRVKIVTGGILNFSKLKKSMQGCGFVFHFAANADVRGGVKDTRIDLDENLIGTWNVLEAMRQNKISKIAFSSSSAVYGEASVIPTPEDYSPVQTSMYGASKLAAEAYIESFCEGFGMQSWIFRFASFMGERYTHGCVFDFVKKLLANPREMEVLGDGRQKKSYLYVKEGIAAMLLAIEKSNETSNIFNIGHDDYMEVVPIADIVAGEMSLSPKYTFTGGRGGWVGDSPFLFLTNAKLKSLGWKPKTSIEDCVRITARYLLQNRHLLGRD